MADTSYPKGMQRLLNGSINLGTCCTDRALSPAEDKR